MGQNGESLLITGQTARTKNEFVGYMSNGWKTYHNCIQIYKISLDYLFLNLKIAT